MIDIKDVRNYNTRQQKAVHSLLESLDGEHITAYQVLDRLHADGVTVGLTTVYRCLERLVQNGQARRYDTGGDQGACYQLSKREDGCNNHYHLKCSECGTLQHTDCKRLNEIGAHMSDTHSFKLDLDKTVFYGRCGQCQNGG